MRIMNMHMTEREGNGPTQSNMARQFTLTKRIAKHGHQSIIVIPKLIEEHLKPGTIVEVKIEVLDVIA